MRALMGIMRIKQLISITKDFFYVVVLHTSCEVTKVQTFQATCFRHYSKRLDEMCP